MITEWKYVVIREEFRNGTETPLLQEHPILFPKTLTHADVGRAVLFSDELMEKGNERDIVAGNYSGSDADYHDVKTKDCKMRQLRAGQTLYALDNNGKLQSYHVITSCYGKRHELIVTVYRNSVGIRSQSELHINEFGFVEYTPPNEAKLRMFNGIEPINVKWCRVYHSRRKAERKVKAGRASVILPIERLPELRTMLRALGRTHGLIPFYKQDEDTRRMEKLLDCMSASSEKRRHHLQHSLYMTADGKVHQAAVN